MLFKNSQYINCDKHLSNGIVSIYKEAAHNNYTGADLSNYLGILLYYLIVTNNNIVEPPI